MQAELFYDPQPTAPVAVVPLDLLRRLVAAAPASLRGDPEVAMLAAEIGVNVEPVRTSIDPMWLADAVRAVRQVALRTAEITAEDVWPLLSRPPARPTDMGAVLAAAAAAGYVAKTDRLAQSSTVRVSGGRQKRIWRSLLIRESDRVRA